MTLEALRGARLAAEAATNNIGDEMEWHVHTQAVGEAFDKLEAALDASEPAVAEWTLEDQYHKHEPMNSFAETPDRDVCGECGQFIIRTAAPATEPLLHEGDHEWVDHDAPNLHYTYCKLCAIAGSIVFPQAESENPDE